MPKPWADVLRSSYGIEATFLTATSDGSLSGVLPIYLFENRMFGRRLMTAPFTSWRSLCVSSEAAERGLIEQAVEAGRSARAGYLELRELHPHALPTLEPSRTEWVDYVMELDEPERMWDKTLLGRARTAVRKARKCEVGVRRGHELLDSFFEVMAISMRNLGTPVHSKAFFGNILRFFGDRAELLVAYVGETPIAVYLVVRDDRRMYHWTGGSRPGFQKANANSLLMWETLELAYESGVSAFDFGRSAAESGTARFKAVGRNACRSPLRVLPVRLDPLAQRRADESALPSGDRDLEATSGAADAVGRTASDAWYSLGFAG